MYLISFYAFMDKMDKWAETTDVFLYGIFGAVGLAFLGLVFYAGYKKGRAK